MTRLLVSVRNAMEAEIALAGGADLIDIKEPQRGSLGAADDATIRDVIERVAGRAPLSAALGELLTSAGLPPSLAGQLRYAKFGLAGCDELCDWPAQWQQALQKLPAGISPIAVAYADWRLARAPDPLQVLEHAQALNCAGVLVDTYDKAQGSLVELWECDDLRRYIAAVQRSGLLCAIAGSLGPGEIARVLPLAPDYVAVRGAACAGDRTSSLDRGRVEELVALTRRARVGPLAVELA